MTMEHNNFHAMADAFQMQSGSARCAHRFDMGWEKAEGLGLGKKLELGLELRLGFEFRLGLELKLGLELRIRRKTRKIDQKPGRGHSLMPHVTIRSQQSGGSSSPERKNSSWSSEIYKFMIRNATPSRSETPGCDKARNNVDQKAFLARLGLMVTQPDENVPLLTESSLTRSPIRSQICRGLSHITMRNLADVDFSSRLGQLLMHQLNANATLSNNATVMSEMKQERYFDGIDSNGRMPQLRARAQIDFPITYTVDKRFKKRNNHTYCFNSKQRRERVRTIASGLNKASRILKRRCKPCCVVLERVKVNLKHIINNSAPKQPLQQLKPNRPKQYTNNSLLKHLPGQIQHELRPQQQHQPMKQLKINQLFNKQNNQSAESPIGKEIILDGSIVIDLCSDDESDDVIVKPKSHASSNSSLAGFEAVNNNNNVNTSVEVKLLDCKVALRDVLDSVVVAPDGQMYICNTQTELNSSKTMKCSPDNIILMSEEETRTQRQDIDANSHKPVLQQSQENLCNDENRRLVRRNASTSLPKPKIATPFTLANNSSNKKYTRCKKLTSTPFVVQFKCHMCNYIGYIGHNMLKEKIEKHVSFYHGGYQNIILVRRISQTTGHVIIELKSDFVEAGNRLLNASS
uniref:Uncharacterized protein n=1 Tax=Strigamia maritima TaxID=126957 RepID=T1J172_STRMM